MPDAAAQLDDAPQLSLGDCVAYCRALDCPHVPTEGTVTGVVGDSVIVLCGDGMQRCWDRAMCLLLSGTPGV